MGDCWSTVTVQISVADTITVVGGQRLAVVIVPQIMDEDVTGTNAQGIPTGDASQEPDIVITTVAGEHSYQDSHDGAVPYPSWIYAFIDLDGDGNLDVGEPFGVDPNNPSDLSTRTGCRDYSGTISIDALYQ